MNCFSMFCLSGSKIRIKNETKRDQLKIVVNKEFSEERSAGIKPCETVEE